MVTEITVGVATALLIALGALVARGFRSFIRDEVKAYLVPNGGSSLADRMTQVEKVVEELANSAKETGCLPGCPRLGGFPPTGMPAPWGHWMPPEPSGSMPDWATTTRPRSRPPTPMPSFVPPM